VGTANFITGAAVNGLTVVEAQASNNISATVTGTLGIAGGGTNATTAAAARANLSPLTTNGDIWTRLGGVDARLAIGANGTCLGVSGGLPAYIACGTGTGTITGSGATNQFALFTSATSIGSGPLSVVGGVVTASGGISAASFTVPGPGQFVLAGTGSLGAILKMGVAGNVDGAGEATLAGGSFTWTFTGGPYTTHPICTANDETALAPVRPTYTGVTSVTFLGTGTDVIGWHCDARN